LTEPNRQRNARRAFQEATSSLDDADFLCQNGRLKSAVSRSYYAALQAARALLFSKGLEASTHSGVAHLVYEHFVAPRLLPPEIARLLRRLQVAREDADYEMAALMTPQMAAESVAEARTYLQAVARILGPLDQGS
jgi:uncharacterized protein (UPF0332 family)